MNTSGFPQFDELRTRRSGRVALVLLGTAGAITAATAIHAWLASRQDDGDQASVPAAPPVTTAQSYANNEFIPGAGYYHAPYHAWFPYPFNYHDPARGYYAGGLWQAAPFALAMLRSQPSNEAVTAALAAQRARDQTQQQRYQGSGGFSRFSSGGSPSSRSAPTATPSSKPGSSSSRPAAPSSVSHVSRGGFGSSGHSSGAS